MGFGSATLIIYAVAIAIVFHLRVILYEEPWLARSLGEQWGRYKAGVPRWIGPRNESLPNGDR